MRKNRISLGLLVSLLAVGVLTFNTNKTSTLEVRDVLASEYTNEVSGRVERKEANKVWGTSVPRTFADELDEFLKENNISKAGFLYMSFDLIKEKYKK